MLRKLLIATLVAASVSAGAQAAVSISGTGTITYSQNFDALAATGTTSAWVNDTTLLGWSLFNKTPAPITSIAVDNGGLNTGSFYSYGATGSAERALGGLASGGAYFGSPASGAVAGYIAAAFTNNTGSQITNVTINYDGEQWRNGGNASTQSMALQFGFGTSFSAVSTWTAAGTSFNWASPVVGTTGAAVNGNVAGLVTNVGGTFATPSWSTGSTLWVRWVENNDTGNDHGLAIDNFSLSVTAVPEPESYAMLLAGIGLMGLIARRRSK